MHLPPPVTHYVRVSEPSLGGDQGPYKEATCTVRPGWPNEHGSYKSRTHTVEDLLGSLLLLPNPLPII